MDDLVVKNMKVIENEWGNMLNGRPVDTNKVSPIIHDSWLRSLRAGVNPYDIDENNVRYNRPLLNLLKIKDTDNKKTITENIQNVLCQIDAYHDGKEVADKEIILNIQGVKKSYIISMQRIVSGNDFTSRRTVKTFYTYEKPV